MKKILTLILIVTLTANCFAAQSKILSWLGDTYKKLGLPTFTEYAWTINLINVYNQTASFVRSTNQLVRSYKKAYEEQRILREKIETLWGKVNNMYQMVDLYDMDTWAAALDRAHCVVWWDCSDIIQSLNLIDYYTVGACTTYVKNINDVFDYGEHTVRNLSTVNRIYVTTEYDTLEKRYLSLFTEYRNSTVLFLKSQLQTEQMILQNPSSTEDQKKTATKRVEYLQEKIAAVEKSSFEASIFKIQTDSVIQMSSELVAYNMTEMQLIEQTVKDFEVQANELLQRYNQLKSNVTNSSPSDSNAIISDAINFTNDKIYGTNADLVTPPQKPDPMNSSKLKTKDVSSHDIIHLQNAIAYETLRQEALLRDLSLIKAKTMSMVTVMEAYSRVMKEHAAFSNAHDFKMIGLSLKDLKQ